MATQVKLEILSMSKNTPKENNTEISLESLFALHPPASSMTSLSTG